MIDSQVRANDVHDRRVVAAMAETPREAFLPEQSRMLAYADRAMETGNGRHMWAPRDFAKLLLAAGVREDDRVLDIAPGAGYSTAVLSRLAAHVCALEDTGERVDALKRTLASMAASNVDVGQGSLAAGRPDRAPFNVIFVNGAVGEAPASWLDQLAEGGRLAVVVADGAVGRARIYTKSGGKASWRSPFESTAPALPGMQRPEVFRL
jgi:protein-L-isoaspartate(D-aspartate) O-methyltransferase